MTLTEISPYVRFARRLERGFTENERIAADHRLFIVEKGSALFCLDGQTYRAEKGDVVFWRAGVPYRVEPTEDTVISGCNFDFLWTDRTEIAPLYPMSAHRFNGVITENPTFTDTDAFDRVCFIRNTYGILPKLHELYEEFESRQIFYQQRCAALMKDILILCLRFYSGNQAKNAAKITRDVLSYIKQHYKEDLTAGQLSEIFHYHPNYISHLVKEQTGLPLHQYIRHYRIYTALELLQSSQLSVTEIAGEVGMGDIHQFSKAFKQIIGISPGTFRK